MKNYPYPMAVSYRHNPHYVDTTVINKISPTTFRDIHILRTTAVWGESIILITPPGIGTVRCSWLNGDPDTMIISDLCVAEFYRYKGVARKLMLAAETLSALCGSSTILLSVDHNSFMRSVYERYGFRPTGEKDECGLDIMTKRTPPCEFGPCAYPRTHYEGVLHALPPGALVEIHTPNGCVITGILNKLTATPLDISLEIKDKNGNICTYNISQLQIKFGNQ